MTYSEITQELQQIKLSLSEIKPVKLESRIQWTGLIGVAQDMWADKKAKKLCKTIIIGEIDYLNLPFHLLKLAKELEEYLKTTENIHNSLCAVTLIQDCYNTWNAICPDISQWTMNDKQWEGHPLPMSLVIKHYLYHSFNEYQLTEELRKENELNMLFIDKQIEKIINPVQDKGSGCLGVIMLIVLPLSSLCCLFL